MFKNRAPNLLHPLHRLHPLASLALAAAACLVASAPALAFNPQPDPPARIGLVSLSASQSLRLMVRVVRSTPTAAAAEVPAGPCRVALGFVDHDGRAIGPNLIGLLRPGQGTKLDLPGAGMVAEGQSLLLHPVVRVLPAVQRLLPAVQSCAVAVSLAVLDPTGRLAVLIDDPNLVTPDSVEQ